MWLQVAEAHAEVEALRRLVKLKTRELKNVRRLAQVGLSGPCAAERGLKHRQGLVL